MTYNQPFFTIYKVIKLQQVVLYEIVCIEQYDLFYLKECMSDLLIS